MDLETRTETWFLRCKSDVFAQQIINSVGYPFLFEKVSRLFFLKYCPGHFLSIKYIMELKKR